MMRRGKAEKAAVRKASSQESAQRRYSRNLKNFD